MPPKTRPKGVLDVDGRSDTRVPTLASQRETPSARAPSADRGATAGSRPPTSISPPPPSPPSTKPSASTRPPSATSNRKSHPQEYWLAPWKFEPSSAALASRSSISLRTIDVCSSFGVIEKLDLDRRTIFSYLRTLEITGGDLPMQTYIPPCPKLERLTLDLRFHCFVRCDLATIARDFHRLAHLKLGGGCDLNIVPAALASLRVLHLFDVYIDGKL